MNSYTALRRSLVASAALLVIALATAGSASASSLVFVKDREVWLSTPDGSVQRQVSKHATDSQSFLSPSQKDDGTIVAIGPGRFFYSFNPDGSLPNAPVLQPTCGGLGFRASEAQVRPAGGLIAYSYVYSNCIIGQGSVLESRTTVMSDTTPTISESIWPHWKSYVSPRWIGNDLFAMIRLGGDRIDLEPELPAQQGPGLSPRPWIGFNQAGLDFDSFDVSRAGNNVLLEITPEGAPAGQQAELVVVNVAPAEGAAITPICGLANFAPAGAKPRWSPDGSQISWTGADGVYVSPAPVADAGGDCVLQPRLIAPGAEDADWGPKVVPGTGGNPGTGNPGTGDPGTGNPGTGSPGTGGPGTGGSQTPNDGTPQGDTVAPVLRVSAKAAKVTTALSKGYTATVGCNEACSISGQLTFAGRLGKLVPAARATTVASGKASLARAGSAKLKLKFTKKARKALKRKRSVKLTLQVTVKDAAGNRSTRTTRVTLKR